MLKVLILVILTSFSIPAIESVQSVLNFRAEQGTRTFYFHPYSLLYEAKDGSTYVYYGADIEYPDTNTWFEQSVKCVTEFSKLEFLFGLIKRTLWGGFVGWVTNPLIGLEHEVRIKGIVDFYVWMRGRGSSFFEGQGVFAGIAEVRIALGRDPPYEILWMSQQDYQGGRNWDMSSDLKEYHLSVEVNHIFNEGNIILFFAGVANTRKDTEFVVAFGAQEEGCSRVIVPWEPEIPTYDNSIGLITSKNFEFYCADDLDYLKFLYDTYVEENIAELFEYEKIYEYDALFIATDAMVEDSIRNAFITNSDLVEKFIHDMGKGLLIMPQPDYEWLPDTLIAEDILSLGEQWFGYPALNDYYSNHIMTTYPYDLPNERSFLITYTLPNAEYPYAGATNFYYFKEWCGFFGCSDVGTQRGIYWSIGQRDPSFWDWPFFMSQKTIWISADYGIGRLTLTTLQLDFHSGHSDNEGMPFYDGREALENMLYWVCKLPYP